MAFLLDAFVGAERFAADDLPLAFFATGFLAALFAAGALAFGAFPTAAFGADAFGAGPFFATGFLATTLAGVPDRWVFAGGAEWRGAAALAAGAAVGSL